MGLVFCCVMSFDQKILARTQWETFEAKYFLSHKHTGFDRQKFNTTYFTDLSLTWWRNLWNINPKILNKFETEIVDIKSATINNIDSFNEKNRKTRHQYKMFFNIWVSLTIKKE